MKKSKLPSNLYWRGNTIWCAFQRDGRRIPESLKTDDIGTAIARAANIKRRLDIAPSGRVLSEHLEAFLADKKRTGKYRRKSLEWSLSACGIFIKFSGDISPDSVPFDIGSEWYADLLDRLPSENSAQSYYRAARAFFSWLVSKHLAHENPLKNFKLPKAAAIARVRFCIGSHRDRLIDSAPDADMQFILYAGFHAGLRKNEIIEARPDWFDLDAGDNGILHVDNTDTFIAKDADRRSVPLTQEFKTFLVNYGLRGPFMLKPDVKHGRSSYRYDFRKPFADYMEAQGCAWVTPHVMRHTFASLLAQDNVSLLKIAKWLGDSLRTTEKHYAHLQAADKDIERGHRKTYMRQVA